jgi:mannose/fructose/N-acetylgalactosamine-specific phosphotransferase system component IID
LSDSVNAFIVTKITIHLKLEKKKMYLIVIAWLYVVLMMAVAEAFSTQGSLLGAVITFILYGLVPLSLVVYIMSTPQRKARRKAEEAAQAQAAATAHASAVQPDASGHAPGAAQDAAVPAVRKEL